MESFYVNLDFKYILKDKTIPSEFETSQLWTPNHFGGYYNYEIIENYSIIEATVKKLNNGSNGYIELIKPTFEVPTITLILQGSQEFINYARPIIFQHYNQISFKTIDYDKPIDPSLTTKLTELTSLYEVEIILTNKKIQLIGKQDNITLAETQIRVLIDSLKGFFIESIDINLSIIPLLGDKNLFNFKEITKQLNSNIYLPDLLPEVFNSQIYQNLQQFKIWITGSKIIEILTTKKLLINLIEKISHVEFLQKTLHVNKEKLDMMILNNQSEILEIMLEHGTFISLPKLGDDMDHEIKIQGNNEEAINETINQINKITQNYYKILINSDNNYQNFQNLLYQIMPNYNIFVKLNQLGMEIIGNSLIVKQLLTNLNSNISNQYLFKKISMAIDVGNEQKDFMSGKKNGKMLKILNQFNNSIVKFIAFNEYQFIINVIIENSINLHDLINIIDLIENELPSEFKFNIPEIFHKSIIGNGGLIIQSIMKKYNVYIKFSSQPKTFNLYGFKRFNNVLIKCPNKNAAKIKLVETELKNLVENCGKNNVNCNYLNLNSNNSIYNSINFKLLKSHYNLITNNFKLNNLNALEIEFASFINWPLSLQEFDTITHENTIKNIEIKGSDIKMKFFINKIMENLPLNYKFVLANTLSPSENFHEQIILPFKYLYNIEICIMNNELWLSYYDTTNLNKAIDELTNWLRVNEWSIVDKLHFEFNPIEHPIDDLKFKKAKKPLARITNEV